MAPGNKQCYLPVDSFNVNVDRNGKVTTDGSGINKSYTAYQTRVYEGDPIIEHMGPAMWIHLEDHAGSRV